jgi:hypothetical protein
MVFPLLIAGAGYAVLKIIGKKAKKKATSKAKKTIKSKSRRDK